MIGDFAAQAVYNATHKASDLGSRAHAQSVSLIALLGLGPALLPVVSKRKLQQSVVDVTMATLSQVRLISDLESMDISG